MSAYLSSKTLVDSVKRRTTLPQGLLSDEDILQFANDEIMDTIVPLIKSNQEEYLVWNETLELQDSIQNYPIPERSIANALRDLCYVDTQGNEYEMARIIRDDRYRSQYTLSYSQPFRYYLENSDIVLVGQSNSQQTGSLKFSYLIRPNQLVLSDNVCKIIAIEEGFVAINSITNGATTTITTVNPHNLSDGESIVIDSVTGDSSINDAFAITYIDDNTFSIDLDSTLLGVFAGGIVFNNTKRFTLNKAPTMFSTSNTVDLIKTRSPHNMLFIDATLLTINLAQNTVSIKSSQVPARLAIGDTIANSGETDIPNIPTELHRVLVNKVCERVLEALGDQQGYAVASQKANQSMANINELIDNRVTSSPLKLKKRHGYFSSRNSRKGRF